MDGTGVFTPAEEETDIDSAPLLSVGRQVWHFARHGLEMCAAMCIGGTILNLLVFVVGPAVLGYPDLTRRYPGLALVLLATLYALPMAAWMRIRGMAWGPTLEMSGATVGVAVVLAALYAVGVISPTGIHALLLASCAPWCAAMVVAMLFRLDLYTGRTGHHMGRRAHTTHAA
jgi:hypothetical protein